MSKFFIGIIAGLAFCHFLPQAALALGVIAQPLGWQWRARKGVEDGREGGAEQSELCQRWANKERYNPVRELKQSDEQIFQRFLGHETYHEIARGQRTTPEHIRQIVVKQQQRIAKGRGSQRPTSDEER